MAKKQENQRGNGPLSGRLVVVMGMILILSLMIGSTVVAQEEPSSVSDGRDRRVGPRTRGAFDELIPALPEAVEASMFSSTLVQTIDTWAFDPPSPDPAGIVYLEFSETLLIADSEVNEMPIFTGDNLFESTLLGSLVGISTTIPWSYEPTGVTYNPDSGHLFFSDDSSRKIYETNLGADTKLGEFSTAAFGCNDPEGVTYAEGLGALFIADGTNDRIYKVMPGTDGEFNGVGDQVTSFNAASFGVTDPEGIAFNPENGLLYIVGNPRTKIAETTTEGILVRMIDTSAANAVNTAGLTCGPDSGGSGETHIYIAARGVDNNVDPDENDGKVYEMTLPPNIPDPTIV
ncbi:MAG TPA: hypothetical protein VLY63_31050, partial [Anaerolineae bacterium]|nr:hypothetical protein [Anaerolineae bacterium]